MSEANAIFTLDGVDLTIKCKLEDKMEDICKNYSTKIKKNMNSLLFLYEGNKVNFRLSFKEQADHIDKNNKEMKILVNENENNNYICSKCDKKNNLNFEKSDEILHIKSNQRNVDCLKNGNLLENIKSIYISKILFSYIDEGIKLKVIKYNKKLQNKIDIILNNYKFYGKKYIIYETNIKGKEYDGYSNDLLYEGEYLNGKRNGKGKDYVDNKLIFEGEYLNDKRDGKGKEYYFNGKLRFEGEYLNGERLKGKLYNDKGNLYCDLTNTIGLIKGYDYSGNLEFEGGYLNGQRNGKGKEYYYDNSLKFEGEYLNGKRNGEGKEYYIWSYELKFEGEYLNGERNGKGKEYYSYDKIKFDGIYNNGKIWNGIGYDLLNKKVYELKNGQGFIKEYGDGKLIFEGEYLNGKRNGKGKEYDDDKLIFEGKYLNGIRNGRGKKYINGELLFEGEYLYGQKLKGKDYTVGKLEYEGEYLYDKKWNGKGYDENGKIIYELNNGNGNVIEYYFDGTLLFEGEYLNGRRNGKGKEYNPEGRLIFEGEYLNGERNGKGKEYDDKLIFEGEYLNGKKNGKGKEYINGKLLFEGEYLNDSRNGRGTLYDYMGRLKFEGEYLNGEKHGKGKEYYKGKLLFEGEYLNDKKC